MNQLSAKIGTEVRDIQMLRKAGHTMNKISVRYIVNDVEAAIPFYTEQLGFHLDFHPAPGFARLTLGGLNLLLNQPGAGGAGQTTNEGVPAPGGWNRILIEVEDLNQVVEALKTAGCHFRSEIITGNGGKQILVNDPSGNAVELFEPARPG
jgi:catechol 2,3-dioxygenase-like lactoylglutathione lyase family enzyme